MSPYLRVPDGCGRVARREVSRGGYGGDMRLLLTFAVLVGIISPRVVASAERPLPRPTDARISTSWNSHHRTPPKAGVARDFVFLVTGISGVERLARYAADPASTHALKLLFASLISDRHDRVQTFGHYGFILGAEASNVIANSPLDTQFKLPSSATKSAAETIDVVERLYREGRNAANARRFRGSYPPSGHAELGKTVIDPEPLLAATFPTINNEVLLAGTSPEGAQVAQIGIFIRTKDGTDLVTGSELEQIENVARQAGLPLVRIPGAAW